MKRIKVRPGRFVSVADALAAKLENRGSALTLDVARRSAEAEPRSTTIYAGPLRPSQRQAAFRKPSALQDETSVRRRIALKVRQMLSATTGAAGPFDVDAWAASWMNEPLDRLGGKTPVQAIGVRGGWEAVEAALESMYGGLPG